MRFVYMLLSYKHRQLKLMTFQYLDTIPMVIGNVQNDRSCLPMSNIV